VKNLPGPNKGKSFVIIDPIEKACPKVGFFDGTKN